MVRNRSIAWTYAFTIAATSGLLMAIAYRPYFFTSCKPLSFMGLKASPAILTMSTLAAAVLSYAYSKGKLKGAVYFLSVLFRYSLAFVMVYFALLFTEGEHWSLSLTMQDTKVADLQANEFTSVFLGYSKTLPYLISGMILLSTCLLAFRRTVPFGAVIGLAVWSPLMIIDHSFDQCTLASSGAIVASLVLVLLPHLPRIIPATLGYKTKTQVQYSFLGNQHHLYRSIGVLKLCLIAGLMVHVTNGIWLVQKYYRSNHDSPIVGVWDIVDIQYASDTGELRRDTIPLEIASFKSLFLDESRYGAVKIDEDTLSTFEYIVDSNYHQLEFWNFWEFKDLDLKGKYYLEDNNTMIYEGTNRKQAIKMVLKRNPKYRAD